MARIHCLHTAASNIAVFDAACPAGVALRHAVRPDLLARAERAEAMPELVVDETRALLLSMADEFDAVLLTCSTLGPAVLGVGTTVPVLRVDQAVVDALVACDGRSTALCTAPTTVAPLRDLIERTLPGVSDRVAVDLVAGAWELFQNSDLAAYHRAIADAADAAFAGGRALVALVQSSMAPAAILCREGVPLTSPAMALRAARAAILAR